MGRDGPRLDRPGRAQLDDQESGSPAHGLPCNNRTLSRLGLIAALALGLLGGVSAPGRVLADTAYTLTVTESAPTMTYGDPSPTFRATLTPPADDPPLAGNTPFYIAIDSTDYAGSLSGAAPPYTLYLNGIGPPVPAAGQHTVTAQYQSPKHGLLTSSPVTLTVLRKSALLTCGVNINGTTAPPGAPVTVTTSFSDSNAPVDWQNGTFTISFVGARTFSFPNLKASVPDEQLSVTTPSAPGVYQTKCDFNGTANFNPIESGSIPLITVSAGNAPGGIALYTNPAPVTRGVMTTWMVVVSPRGGLPAPTGYVNLRIGQIFTGSIALAARGTVTFQLVGPAIGPGEQIQVFYHGDPVYSASNATFPPATQPIPGAVSAPGPTSRPPAAAPSADPTPAAAPSPSPSEIPLPSPASPAPTRVDASPVAATSGPRLGGPTLVAVAGVAVAVVLLGTGSGLAWRRGRRRRAPEVPPADGS